MSNIQLMQGDCLELMGGIPDKSVDLILCDPPYGTTACKWNTIIPFEPLWEQYNRIAKENAAIVLFCAQPFTTKLISSNLQNFSYCWIWYKHYARGFLNAKQMPLKCTEDIAVFYRKQCVYNPQMRKGKMKAKGGKSSQQQGVYGNYNPSSSKNDLYYPQTLLDFVECPQGSTVHPTQKPVELLEYLIKTYTNEGDTVLDNCMGSGSTGVAAVNTNRNFIGIELDDAYFKTASDRIRLAQDHPDLQYKKSKPSDNKKLF